MAVHTMWPKPGQHPGGPTGPWAPPTNSWGPAPGAVGPMRPVRPVRPVGPVGPVSAANPLPQAAGNVWAGPPMAVPAGLPPGPLPVPGWPNSFGGQRDTSRRVWALLGVAAAVVIVVALIGVAVVVAGSAKDAGTSPRTTSTPRPSMAATAATPAPIVPVESLPGLLLDAGTLSTIMGSNLVVNRAATSTRLYTDTTNRPECGGVWANANRDVYEGSGWVSVQNQSLHEPVDDFRHLVFQSVISFSSAEAAANFVAKEAKSWPQCAGGTIITTNPNRTPQIWWIASVSQRDGMLTALSMQQRAGGWRCQRALTARNNVVIDVEACGPSLIDQGPAIAREVANRLH
jgi:serine/threonine kinase PknH